MTSPTNGSGDSSMTAELSGVNGDLSPSAVSSPPSKNLSNISSLLERLQCKDEDIIVDTLQELQKVASGVYCCCLRGLLVDYFGSFGCVSESEIDDSFDDWCPFLSPLCRARSSGVVVSRFLFCSFSL
ncbi:hypothetical protein BLNAU_11356 [Blattamonas nauphoetae]|uniref:Uncharacterized protein n=1 Tax=Blattamonas nauphoetae TaxID=2049346 RepID=A0ABQ9XSL3_9EUKA|nr:hypothetical protein BLNAU_11356 [Blattamonas nauphoetae]